MIVEWIKYSNLSKEKLIGHRIDEQRRVWLLPGTTFSIWRNALQRVIGYDSRAWDTCRTMAKKNINPVGTHGLIGKTGVGDLRIDLSQKLLFRFDGRRTESLGAFLFHMSFFLAFWRISKRDLFRVTCLPPTPQNGSKNVRLFIGHM